MISQNTISKIFEYARIEEVVGDFVKLKKSGVNYKGNCPFHNEKTPSFMVNPVKNIFKCFGCGESGNPVTFVMKHEHFTFPEALKYLAGKYSITIEDDNSGEDTKPEFEEKESLYALNAFAQKYFAEMLLNTENGKAIALTYLEARDIKRKEIDKFMLGYNPDVWDAFTTHAIKNGYSITMLEKAGLTVFKDTGSSYDRFKGRIIFPVQNVTGRIVGFGARLIGKAENRPKYVNSPETEIYLKSKILYGLFHAKNKISTSDNCYLVEGYTDVISMHRAGIENVVASSGTSLTTDQIRLIKRYTENITILYDGDPAGIKASLRGMNMILEEGMNVKIVLFPEGEDPDSFAKSRPGAEVQSFIETNATDFVKFKTKMLLKESENDPVKKASLVKDIIETIAVIPNAILRSLYIRECATLLNLGEQALTNHLATELRKNIKKEHKDSGYATLPVEEFKTEKQVQFDPDDASDDERNLIRFMLLYANNTIPFIKEEALGKSEIREDDKYFIKIAAYYITEIVRDGLKFDGPILQQIFDEFAMAQSDEAFPSEQNFLQHTDDAIRTMCIDLVSMPYHLSENWEKKHGIITLTESQRLPYFADWYLDNFKSRKIHKLIRDYTAKLKTAPSEEHLGILQVLSKLNELKIIIAKKMTRNFIK